MPSSSHYPYMTFSCTREFMRQVDFAASYTGMNKSKLIRRAVLEMITADPKLRKLLIEDMKARQNGQPAPLPCAIPEPFRALA